MTPLKVTCVLDGPVAGEVPMLDALVEGAVSVHHVGRLGLRHVDRDGEAGNVAPWAPGTIPTPIVRREVPGYPWSIPLASSPIFVATSDSHAHYTRKFGVDVRLLGEHRVIAPNMGEFKSHRLPLRLRTIDRVVWFCVTGREPRLMRKVLKQIEHLGKKTSQGYGRVREWVVEQHPEDWSWFAPSDSGAPVLMRPLPLDAVPDDVVGAASFFGGVVPPYWCADHFGDGFRPC